MFLRISILVAVLASSLALTALLQRATEATGTFCADDPIGDFIDGPLTVKGNGSGLPDIVQVCAESDGTDFTLTVEFNEPIVPPPSGGETTSRVFRGGLGGPVNAVAGFIDFDTDQDPNTWLGGPIGNVTEFCPDPSGMGVDAYGGVFDGDSLAFFNSNGVLAIPIDFGSSSLTVNLPLSELGGDTDLNFGIVFGNLDMPTDCFPGEEGFVTPFEGKEPSVTPTSTEPALTPTSTEPAPTPTDSAAGPTAVAPTATVGVVALPTTGSGSDTSASVAVLWGLAGAGVVLAGAAGVFAVRHRP